MILEDFQKNYEGKRFFTKFSVLTFVYVCLALKFGRAVSCKISAEGYKKCQITNEILRLRDFTELVKNQKLTLT